MKRTLVADWPLGLLAGFCAGSTILAFGSQAQAAKAASPKVDKTSAAIAAYADELVIPTYKTMSDNALKFAKAAKELKAAPTDAKVAEAGKLLLETRDILLRPFNLTWRQFA